MTSSIRRPLVISDCDEVLLHMLVHFRAYLDEEHAVDFAWEGGGFKDSMRRRGESEPLADEEMWRLLNLFFDTEMHRQTPIPGAIEAMAELSRDADVVILTNLQDHRAEMRARQLAGHGIHARVFTNQGPKGPALRRIIDEFGARRVAFIDDIAVHHASVAQDANHVVRLHLVGEPQVAPYVPCAFAAGDADARIDNWQEALPWLLEKLHQGDPEES